MISWENFNVGMAYTVWYLFSNPEKRWTIGIMYQKLVNIVFRFYYLLMTGCLYIYKAITRLLRNIRFTNVNGYVQIVVATIPSAIVTYQIRLIGGFVEILAKRSTCEVGLVILQKHMRPLGFSGVHVVQIFFFCVVNVCCLTIKMAKKLNSKTNIP